MYLWLDRRMLATAPVWYGVGTWTFGGGPGPDWPDKQSLFWRLFVGRERLPGFEPVLALEGEFQLWRLR